MIGKMSFKKTRISPNFVQISRSFVFLTVILSPIP